MALAAASLRTGPVAQPSPGGGYLRVQEGKPGVKIDTCQLSRHTGYLSGWECYKSLGLQNGRASCRLGSAPCLSGVYTALPGLLALAQPLHSTSPQALREYLLSQGKTRMTTAREGDGWALPTENPEERKGQGLMPHPAPATGKGLAPVSDETSQAPPAYGLWQVTSPPRALTFWTKKQS